MRRSLWFILFAALAACRSAGQECSTTVLVSFYDQLTTNEIETLKADDVEVKMDGTTLPLLGFTRDFTNRLVILLETDGADKNDKLAEIVDRVTRQARTAPEGKPVAVGIFADKAIFTKGFFADTEKRTAAVNEVIEEAGSLGKRVALWDSLHEALALFGAHQPGDTIMLVGDPYDDKSHHSPGDVEKELVRTGTRLFMLQRAQGSRVDRPDFLWTSHEAEKNRLDRMTQETGGLLSAYVPSLIRFAWAGYLLEFKLPPGMDRPRKWKVRFRGAARDTHRKTNFHYPNLLPPWCAPKSSP
jgi:hypothetical protein